MFVGLVEPVQETCILPWPLWSAWYKNFFFLTVHYFNVSPSQSNLGGSRAGPHVSEFYCLREELWLDAGRLFRPPHLSPIWSED